MTIIKSVFLKLHNNCRHICFRRYCSTKKDIRNIGILAHIDAGKTTTTERMLFYAGKTRTLGEVHRGTTVTDYLMQERERGITICSSAVTFAWQDKCINLLDTPGHIDFTMEVEQSLYAVDSVVVVLDATAGVEAQTNTVWAQAEQKKLPKLVFVNKMDRPEADLNKCLLDLRLKLDACAVCLQEHEKDENGNINIIDLITLQRIKWNHASLGRSFVVTDLDESDALLKCYSEQRNEIIDRLSGIDDDLADVVIQNEGFDKITNTMLKAALRRATCQHKVVPVLLGSAYKNVGIQPLMNAVVDYLPAPNERNQYYDCFGKEFVGKVFKIVHDKQRGPLTLVRVFRGELKKGMKVITAHGVGEVIGKIYEPLADEYREVQAVQSGDVAICAGLKNTVTGDLLAHSTNSFKMAEKRLKNFKTSAAELEQISAENSTKDNEADCIKHTFVAELKIPDPVYFCAIEPPSLATQNAMELALKQLQREDPSLRVKFDEVTGQTVLGGMGELHMDIIKSRILSEYKIEVELGPLQIAYKETIEDAALDTLVFEKEIAGAKQSVAITLELTKHEDELFSIDKSPEHIAKLNALRPRILQVVRKGSLSALERGPRVGGHVIDTQIKLHDITIGRGTADSFVMAAAAQCVQKVLKKCGTRLLEPIMSLQILVPNERTSPIISDLSRRRAVISDINAKNERYKVILVSVPLAELSGYSSALRTMSSGTASFTMQPCGFSQMKSNEEEQAIRRSQGLE